MATKESSESETPFDEVMEDIRGELVRRVAAADRDAIETSTTHSKTSNALRLLLYQLVLTILITISGYTQCTQHVNSILAFAVTTRAY